MQTSDFKCSSPRKNTVSILVPCSVVEMKWSEFLSKSNSSLRNTMSLWPVFSCIQYLYRYWPGLIIKALHKVNGPITNRLLITNRELIGPGPIRWKLTAPKQHFFRSKVPNEIDRLRRSNCIESANKNVSFALTTYFTFIE